MKYFDICLENAPRVNLPAALGPDPQGTDGGTRASSPAGSSDLTAASERAPMLAAFGRAG